MSQRPDREASAELQYQTEHTDPGRAKSVIPYLVLLVVAAFALLFMAYLMQARMEQSVQGLNQSATTFQTIDQLVDDNRVLHEEVAQLRDSLSDSEDQRESLENQLKAAEERLSQLQSELAITRQQLAQYTGEAQESPAP